MQQPFWGFRDEPIEGGSNGGAAHHYAAQDHVVRHFRPNVVAGAGPSHTHMERTREAPNNAHIPWHAPSDHDRLQPPRKDSLPPASKPAEKNHSLRHSQERMQPKAGKTGAATEDNSRQKKSSSAAMKSQQQANQAGSQVPPSRTGPECQGPRQMVQEPALAESNKTVGAASCNQLWGQLQHAMKAREAALNSRESALAREQKSMAKRERMVSMKNSLYDKLENALAQSMQLRAALEAQLRQLQLENARLAFNDAGGDIQRRLQDLEASLEAAEEEAHAANEESARLQEELDALQRKTAAIPERLHPPSHAGHADKHTQTRRPASTVPVGTAVRKDTRVAQEAQTQAPTSESQQPQFTPATSQAAMLNAPPTAPTRLPDLNQRSTQQSAVPLAMPQALHRPHSASAPPASAQETPAGLRKSGDCLQHHETRNKPPSSLPTPLAQQQQPQPPPPPLQQQRQQEEPQPMPPAWQDPMNNPPRKRPIESPLQPPTSRQRTDHQQDSMPPSLVQTSTQVAVPDNGGGLGDETDVTSGIRVKQEPTEDTSSQKQAAVQPVAVKQEVPDLNMPHEMPSGFPIDSHIPQVFGEGPHMPPEMPRGNLLGSHIPPSIGQGPHVPQEMPACFPTDSCIPQSAGQGATAAESQQQSQCSRVPPMSTISPTDSHGPQSDGQGETPAESQRQSQRPSVPPMPTGFPTNSHISQRDGQGATPAESQQQNQRPRVPRKAVAPRKDRDLMQALHHDAPELLKELTTRGLVESMSSSCGDIDTGLSERFSSLEALLEKIFHVDPEKQSNPTGSNLMNGIFDNSRYCTDALASLMQYTKTRSQQADSVRWGWCDRLHAFIFVLSDYNRIVLERPQYGYATYFFCMESDTGVDEQLQRIIATLAVPGVGRSDLLENKPLEIGKDLSPEDAEALERFGWKRGCGLASMLNFAGRTMHDYKDRDKHADLEYWRKKIGEALMQGKNTGRVTSRNVRAPDDSGSGNRAPVDAIPIAVAN